MAIDVNKIKWAENLEVDAVSGLPNKAEPPEELKLSGTKRAQNLTRQHFNYLADQYHEMFGNIQQQINDLTVSAGAGTLQAVFPVGSYWFNANSNTNPATSLGFGTWIRVSGKFIVGVDEGDTTWDVGLKTGGNKNHAHTASANTTGGHSHSGAVNAAGAHNHNGVTGGTALTIAQMPSHSHQINLGGGPTASFGNVAGSLETVGDYNTTSVGSGQAHTHTLNTDGSHSHTIPSDGSHTHTITITNATNVPPFEAAFVWRRTA